VSQTVLFICSGNFYRSRYAEAVFNHLAPNALPSWSAVSRGFKPHLATEDLSYLARERLQEKDIPLHHTAEKPCKLSREDLEDATVIVSLLESQHRPLMKAHFPEFEEVSLYWEVYDIEDRPAEISLSLIDENVTRLIADLS